MSVDYRVSDPNTLVVSRQKSEKQSDAILRPISPNALIQSQEALINSRQRSVKNHSRDMKTPAFMNNSYNSSQKSGKLGSGPHSTQSQNALKNPFK